MLTIMDVYKRHEQQIETPLAQALNPGLQAEGHRDHECSPCGLPGLSNGGDEAPSKPGDSGRKNKGTYQASFTVFISLVPFV